MAPTCAEQMENYFWLKSLNSHDVTNWAKIDGNFIGSRQNYDNPRLSLNSWRHGHLALDPYFLYLRYKYTWMQVKVFW